MTGPVVAGVCVCGHSAVVHHPTPSSRLSWCSAWSRVADPKAPPCPCPEYRDDQPPKRRKATGDH